MADEGKTLNFDCGCFVSFWADEEAPGVLRSTLGCCQEHDASHQSIEALLHKGYYLAIKKKYVEPKIDTIKQQLENVRTRYPDAQILKHKKWGDILLLTMPVNGEKWNTTRTRIAIGIPNGFPAACPKYFWLDSELKLKSGMHPHRVGYEQEDIFGPMHMLQGCIQDWRYTMTLYTAIKIVALALQWRFERPQYKDYGD